MKVKFITFGCSRNVADTELMKGYASKRHEIVDKGEEVTVVNTCFVKKETEKKIVKLLHKIKGKVVIAGCLAQARPQLIEAFPQASIIGVNKLERINDAIEGQIVDVGEGEPDFCADRVFNNPFISIVPISSGCLGNCTYCCTRQARGVLRSRSPDNILRQIKKDLKKNVTEIWLTSEDTGCYGFDINYSLPELINKITSLKGKFRIRVGMMNPWHVLKILPELKDAMSHEKVYKFIHIPVQSGSDKVLADMNRHYTAEDFLKIVNAFKGFNISTDIICGYPTESEEDWKKTVELIRKVMPEVLNISRFFPRPGTAAAMLKQLPSGISKERSRELLGIHKKIRESILKKLVGRKCEILSTSGSNGRDEFYRLVHINAGVGFHKAIITGYGRFLKGKII